MNTKLSPARRQQRSHLPHVAMSLQLRHVADRLNLDAIVLADDLGLPLASSGDLQLTELLAEASMWTSSDSTGVDWYTSAWLEAMALDEHNVTIASRLIPHQNSFWRVTAVGPISVTCDGLEHAVKGIKRIAAFSSELVH